MGKKVHEWSEENWKKFYFSTKAIWCKVVNIIMSGEVM